MIAIFDNGKIYSEHRIYFVSMPKANLSTLQLLLHETRSEAFLLAAADSFTWYRSRACDVRDFLSAVVDTWNFESHLSEISTKVLKNLIRLGDPEKFSEVVDEIKRRETTCTPS